ncbi:hypothetical protein JCM11491_000166 [Sporobolomyces phaffii]
MRRRPNLEKLRSDSSFHGRLPREEPIGIKAVAFGIFDHAASTFSAEYERHAGSNDGIRFENETRWKKRALMIEIGVAPKAKGFRVSIELSNIVKIHRSSGGTSFYLHLRLAPRFETVTSDADGSGRQAAAQISAFDDEHATIAPYASKVLRVTLRDSREVRPFLLRIEATQSLPRVVSSRIHPEPSRRILATTLDELAAWMLLLELPLAFQIAKLLENGLIEPLKLLTLRAKIEDIVRVQGSARGERILVLFADSLVRLEELGDEPPAIEIVLSDDDEHGEERPGTDARSSQKRKRESAPDVGVARDARAKSIVLDSAESESDDDDVILPPSFISHDAASRTPHDLSSDELLALLDHAVTRSVVFAPLLALADASQLARHVTITQTGFILSGPTLESSNSIARRYGRPECFLRVAVRNEDGTLLGKGSGAIIDSRFKQIFRNGLVLGGRSWSFLAWSASALKSGVCFFVAPFEVGRVLHTPEVIHRDIGNFQGDPTARVPAKYFARISQAFTSSRPSFNLDSTQVLRIPELVADDGSLFSDGVGTISPSLAAEVVSALGIAVSNKKRTPTCFQVRIGGAKGMLQVDPALNGKTMALRPSQIKFQSEMSSLEIADIFPARAGFLNRPLIKVLEDLGVPAQAFLALQRAATSKVRKSRLELPAAIRLLEKWNLSHSSRLSSTLTFLARDRATSSTGFSNPFVSQCLDAAVVHVLRDIKYKARIPLPGCYNLVGVVDISDTLAEGEIYARVQRTDGKSEYLEGTVAISRSPTNHPGDVQLVRAVGKLPPGGGDRIRNLVNCVVFSARGKRSVPSMLAGGDLDGDLYLIITKDCGLVPQKTYPPAAYDAAPTTRLDRDATLDDGIDFFFDYLANDLTATVATRQLLLADHYSRGLLHPDCLKLAQLHSDCVDYVKSGTAVNLDAVPKIPLEMKERGGRPDFASIPGQDSYRSPRALGQLYREIDRYLDSIKPPALDPTLVDPLRSVTRSLLAIELPDGTRLAPDPPRELVEDFKSHLAPFATELAKLADLCHPPAQEAELFVRVLVKSRVERGDKLSLSNRGERVDALFELARTKIAGSGRGTKVELVRAWSAWIAAVASDEEHAVMGRKGKFGLRSWAFLALGVLADAVGRLERESVEVIVID